MIIKRGTGITSPQEKEEDYAHSTFDLRPKSFDEYPGQERIKENLKVFVQAAIVQEKQLDHILLHGPPGLGKTTLANIIAKELRTSFYSTSGPSLDRPGDLAGILSGLEQGSVFFIDEIHRLSVQVEEVLYSAMEDYAIDLVVGQGVSARSVRLPVAPFTLVGATTRLSSLSSPFLSRFGIQSHLEFYNEHALLKILQRTSKILDIKLSHDGGLALVKRSRGTPRISNRLLKRVWDFAVVQNKSAIDKDLVDYALERLDIDANGLDRTDRNLLKVIGEQYGGGPVGIETISATLGEQRSTLEEVYEPYLIHSGYLFRGPRGRSLTAKGKNLITS